MRFNLFVLALLSSLAIHILFVLLLPSTKPVSKDAPLQIEIRETKAASGPKPGRGLKRGSIHAQKTTSLSQLKPGWQPGAGTVGKQAAQASGNSDSSFNEEEWGSHGGNFKEIENATQYQRLQHELQGMLEYPYKLAKRGIHGGVNLRLAFDKNSECDWTRSQVGGDNHLLRVYALALVKKLCTLNAVKDGHFKEHQFVDIGFLFAIDPEKLADVDTLHSNVLMFRRSYGNPPMEFHLGPLQGYFFAPVMIVDVGWLMEHWDQYVNGHDPLAEFKDP